MSINIRDFIQQNYTPYNGDDSFLSEPTNRTKSIWQTVSNLVKDELKKGILDLDVENASSITSHKAGYIDKENEIIFGLQTDAPLKRSIKPHGGIRMIEKAAKSYGYEIPENIIERYTKHRMTHSDAVFSAYTKEHLLLRKKHIITGLPDSYGRGRIIGDYRRVSLYGVDYLIEQKKLDFETLPPDMDEENIRIRFELKEQIKSLSDMKIMASFYGYDISKPAKNTKEAIQWIYFAYLSAIKEQDGAAMSLGRIDAFLDIYSEKDLKDGVFTESEIQEMVDDFVIKLRMVRHLRPPEYNALFAGDPTWVTLSLGGTGINGTHIVTKMSYRFLHTLTNLGPAPEPNLTILWGNFLPDNWKSYCAKQSIKSSSIQYENDDLMKQYFGDDYGIACCVSGMTIGKDMQYFGARANLAKLLLLTINGGKEEPIDHGDHKSEGGEIIIPDLETLDNSEYLDYEIVWNRFLRLMDWLAERYVNTMNVIHYMHDRYHYESIEMALHDTQVRRLMAFGIAGFSVVVDSLSAIKYAKVKPIWNKNLVAEDYEIHGKYPTFGNDDDRADSIGIDIIKAFNSSLKKYKTYRNSVHTLSILTITSNVVYGECTGKTPDMRKSGSPFAPGANPMHGRDENGAIASLNSVAKMPYEYCLDGISNTFSIVPQSLGKTENDQINNLVQLLNGYFVGKKGHHLNVNVLDREMLKDAQNHPEKYPQLTVRVSGYAVLFNRLNKYQQDEVIERTFHKII